MGSVDEESTKSDEEYDDLAMQDVQENGHHHYQSDDNDEYDHDHKSDLSRLNAQEDKYRENLDHILRTRSQPVLEPSSFYSSSHMAEDENEKKMAHSGNIRMRKRSLSIPALGKHGSLGNGTFSGPPHSNTLGFVFSPVLYGPP